jgi:serine/threonine protein kinase
VGRGTIDDDDDVSSTAQAPGTPSAGRHVDDPLTEDLPPTDGIPPDAEAMRTPKPGDKLFGRYIVVRQLDEGGMGTVWLVRHIEFDSERALKLIVSGISKDEQARARFRREARIMDRITHRNVVRVYDVWCRDGVAFIEMEYVRGTNLKQLLDSKEPMPPEWVAEFLRQLCDALQCANDAGIIHRDLKPLNLMITEDDQTGGFTLKLLDFGIAKIRELVDDVHTRTGSFMGTPGYASPEQICGDPQVDARSDIYSVGVILYELLTGYRPFDGALNALIYKHTMIPPPRFAEVNPNVRVLPSVEAVVLRCLAKAPDERPQSPSELARIFHDALAQVGVPPAQDAEMVETGSEQSGALDQEQFPPTSDARVVETRPEGGDRLTRGLRLAGPVVGLLAALLFAGVQWRKSPILHSGSAGNEPRATAPSGVNSRVQETPATSTARRRAGASRERDVERSAHGGTPPGRVAEERSVSDSRPTPRADVPTGAEYILKAILDDARSLKKSERATARYFSINHLLAAGAGSDVLDLHRDALARCLARLSRTREPAPPRAIEPTRTVFHMDLRSVGWDDHPFERIATVEGKEVKESSPLNRYDLFLLEYPYGIVPISSESFDRCTQEFLGEANPVRPIPYLRADWFVNLAVQSSIKDEFLRSGRDSGAPAVGRPMPSGPEIEVSRRFLETPLSPTAARAELESVSPPTVFDAARVSATPLAVLAGGGAIRREPWEDAYDDAVQVLGLGLTIAPLDAVTRGDILPAMTGFDVALATNKADNVFHPGDRFDVIVTNKSKFDIYIELVLTDSEGWKVILTEGKPLVKAGDVAVNPGMSTLKIQPGTGKETITLFASDARFPDGVLHRGAPFADRLVHSLHDAGYPLTAGPDRAGILKHSIEIDTR